MILSPKGSGARALDRRRFLAVMAAGTTSVFSTGTASAQDVPAEDSASGRLFDPRAAGRPRDRAGEAENDPTIVAIEKQLKCTCGCNLDIFTCRTTDFSCTYSPALHKEIVAWRDEGRSPEQVIDAYLAEHGEEFRMAPKPRGFNLAGYLVPGILVLLAAVVLALVLRSRARPVPASAPPDADGADRPTVPGATVEELERLRREVAGLDR
ncbi:MAG: cytochrome c-type biogenesis protein CcmH [Gemmatimonadales bacterium]